MSILQTQASALTKRTNGVLTGRVTIALSDDDTIILDFGILVRELDDYQHRIMVVRHKKDLHYPAVVDAEIFRDNGIATLRSAMKTMTAMGPCPFS